MLLLHSRPLRAREDLYNIYSNWWDDYRRFYKAITAYCFYKVQELPGNRYHTSRSGILIDHLDRYSSQCRHGSQCRYGSQCRHRSQGHHGRHGGTGHSYLGHLGHLDSYATLNSQSRQVRSRIFLSNLVKLSHDLGIFSLSYFGTALRHIQCVA